MGIISADAALRLAAITQCGLLPGRVRTGPTSEDDADETQEYHDQTAEKLDNILMILELQFDIVKDELKRIRKDVGIIQSKDDDRAPDIEAMNERLDGLRRDYESTKEPFYGNRPKY